MNTRVILLPILILTTLIFSQTMIFAQEANSSTWLIKTNNGNEYSGLIINVNDQEIELQTESLGLIKIQRASIKKITEVQPENIKGNEVWIPNPQEGRYFFSPSSYGLKKGESYYQNTWIFFNQYSHGFTDNFSLGIGTVPLFLLAGTSSPFWLTPKFSFPSNNERFGFGAGALVGTVVGEGGSFGIVYGTSTVGTRENNATLGVGYGFQDGEFNDIPTISFSAMVRTGKKGYFVTENYLVDSSLGLFSFGGRRIWNNASLDYGGIIPIGSEVESFAIIPWLSFVVTFD